MSERRPQRAETRDAAGPSGRGDVFWTSRAGGGAPAIPRPASGSPTGSRSSARSSRRGRSGPSEYGSVLLALAAVHALVDLPRRHLRGGDQLLRQPGAPRPGPRRAPRAAAPVAEGRHRDRRGRNGARGGAVRGARRPRERRAARPDLVQISALSVLVTTADSTAFAALALARRVDLRARALAATSAFRLIGVIIAVQFGGAEAVAISYVLGGAAGSLVLATVRVARGLAPVGAASPARSPSAARSAPGSCFASASTRA